MKKKKAPRLINAFQKSEEFQEAFELYKEKKQSGIEGENDPQSTLNDPKIEVQSTLVDPGIDPQTDPPVRVGCQDPENEGAVEGADLEPEPPSEGEVSEDKFATLEDLEELQEEVRELRTDKKDLLSDLSEVKNEIEDLKEVIEGLKEVPIIHEHLVRTSAWGKIAESRESQEESS